MNRSDRSLSTAVDVLVIGAGPAGLTAAVAAARGGARVLVLERHSGTSIFPKATGIRPRSMEILRSWGLDEQVKAGSQHLRLAGAISATLAEPVMQEISLGAPDVEDLRRVSPSSFAISPQDYLEPLLLESLRANGGSAAFGTELLDLRAQEDGVLARVRSTATGATSSVKARFLIGADGADSTVRRLAGIGVRVLGSEGEHLAVLFRADLARRITGGRYALHMVAAPGVAGVFVPSGADDRWVYDREWHPDRGERLADWTRQRWVDAIRAAAGAPDLRPEILRVFPWCFGAAVADRMQEGRVFLVGDAAHRTTPRGATGMNTGIADGHNLGWKLAWVVRGWAGDALLDTYAEERYPVGVENASRSLVSAIERPMDGLQHDFGVVYRSSGIQTIDDDEDWSPLHTAVPGGRAPHAWISVGGRRISTLDLFDGTLTLVTAGCGPRWRAAAAGAAECGLPLRIVALGEDAHDLSGSLIDSYRLAGGSAVLVRPDGHVAGRVPDPSSLTVALQCALGRVPSALAS